MARSPALSLQCPVRIHRWQNAKWCWGPEQGWGCLQNLGFFLYPEMGLPLVKTVASKQTLKNPVYQSLLSQFLADETTNPQQDLLALGKLTERVWVPIVLFPFAFGHRLNITPRCRPRQCFLARCNPTLSFPPPLPTPNSTDSIGGRGLTRQDQDTRSWWKEKV